MTRCKRIDIPTIKKIVEDKNGILLGPIRIKNRLVYQIKCNIDNNIFYISRYNLNKGIWCKQCSDRLTKINRENIEKVVKEKGYKLITAGPLNRTSRFYIKCYFHNLKWETTYGNLKYTGNSNGSCRLCARNSVGYKELIYFIENKNGTLVDRIFDKGMKLVIRCNKHNCEWKTRWSALRRGNWCKECEDESRIITHDQIQKLVESYGGNLLTDNCSTATMKFWVSCYKDQHKWETNWARIKAGCWCPACGFKSQIRLFEIIKELFPNYICHYNFNQFEWLKLKEDKKAKLQLDIFVHNLDKSFSLAIEYDGEQHFRPVKFSQKISDEEMLRSFNITQLRDKKKDELIKQHSNEIKYFIRIPYTEQITKENIIYILKEHNVSCSYNYLF